MADGRITIDTKIDQSGIDEGVKTMQSKLNGVAGKMDKVGKTMSATVTAPIAGITGAIVKVGMDFQSSMSHVQAVTGATGSEMQKLEALARELGETTKFSANDAAEAMGFLGMAGYDTNQIMSSMPGLLDLAAAGQLELGRAADIATNIVSGFNMTAEDTGMVSDVLAKAAASANTSVEQLGGAMSYVAPVASGAGLSLEETAAAIGVLSDNGIQGERAGTALRGVIASLQNPTGGTARALEKLGLSAEDVDPSMNSLADILRKLEDAGIDSKTAMELVGVEAGPALIAMLNKGSDGLEEFTQDLANSEGAAAQMAKTMSDNAKGSSQEFQSALEGIALAFADILLPVVTDFLDFLTTLVRKFGEIPVAGQKIILIVSGIAAAIGPLLLVVSSMIKVFTTLMPIIKGVGTAIGLLVNPIGLVIAAIAGLVALVVIYWDEIKVVTEVVFGWIAEFLPSLWNGIKNVTSIVWSAIKNVLFLIWNGIKNAASIMFNGIKNTISTIWNTIKNVTSIVWNAIKNVLSSIWNGIKIATSTVFNGIKNTISTIWNTIKNVTGSIWNGIKNIISSIINSMSSVISRVFNTIKNTISGVWNGVKSATDRIWNSITDSIKGAVNAIIGAINSMLGAIGSISIPIPKIPDWVPGLGGKGGGSIGFPKLPKIPSLDVGTNFVAKDGLAFLHKGEAVVPRKYNPAAGGRGGDTNITVQEMHVRSEEDIYKVSRQLKRLQDRALLSKGTRGVNTV